MADARLQALATDGDPGAALELAVAARRRGHLLAARYWLHAAASWEDERLRLRVVEAGPARPALRAVTPLGLLYLTGAPARIEVAAPLAVPTAWTAQVGRVWACRCVERGLLRCRRDPRDGARIAAEAEARAYLRHLTSGGERCPAVEDTIVWGRLGVGMAPDPVLMAIAHVYEAPMLAARWVRRGVMADAGAEGIEPGDAMVSEECWQAARLWACLMGVTEEDRCD